MNRYTAKVLALSAATATAACSTTYYKDGASSQQIRQDFANCRVAAAMVPYNGDGLATAIVGRATLENCLTGKGYYTR